MRPLPGKLASLAAFAAMLVIAGGPVFAADEKEEKPRKESKDVQTGKKMHVMFTQQMGVHQDLELQEYVQRVGERLAAVSERPDLDWHFTIIDTDDVNAFATMGGYVYISRGILPYFKNEADLAAVLGHEIGHITAEHLKKQNRKGMLSGLASAATAIFTGMPALADLTSMAGQAIISGYGREAELEADRLGANYLAQAGYDPESMIHVITTLKNQDTFERERARLEGREPRIYHGVFASHPDNDTRLQQAVAGAGKVAAAATGKTQNTEGFMQAIEGLPVGSSERQGMVRENRFYHADMQFTLAFPQGWQVVNQPEKILAIAPQKAHVIEIRAQPPPADITDPREFAMRGLASRRLDHTDTFETNGLKGWTGIVRGDPSPYGPSSSVRYIVIYYGNLMWVFKGASRSGTATPSGDPFFLSTAQTFRRMRASEFPLAEPYRLHVLRAAPGTTMEKLAQESSIKKYPQQQLRLFNGLYPNGEPRPGDLVKTVR
jgi:predicted Zn-dependent protease